jgi:hypothetical protein
MKSEKNSSTQEKAELLKVTRTLLKAMFLEFKELSKKKPEGVVSKSKIKVVNRLLEKCKNLLQNELSIEYLDLLDEDDLPQNSDIVLMLSQYDAALDQFFAKAIRLGWYK